MPSKEAKSWPTDDRLPTTVRQGLPEKVFAADVHDTVLMMFTTDIRKAESQSIVALLSGLSEVEEGTSRPMKMAVYVSGTFLPTLPTV